MNEYNTQFGARDIFANPAFAQVFPQFTKDERLKNVYSFAETEERVKNYLVAALNGRIAADGGIVVKGQHQSILNRVKALQSLLESMFNNIPKIVAAIRRNTPLYLPYATEQQLKDLKTRAQKQRALRLVLDNFQYNENFGALNSIKREQPDQFRRGKSAWERRVGYKPNRRLKRI